MGIVALEITKFSKRYAMEWLLSEEFKLHIKHETQRKKPDNLSLPAPEEKEKESVKKKWNCPSCTFTNLELMPYCEMCGRPRNSKGKSPPEFPSKKKAAKKSPEPEPSPLKLKPGPAS